MRLRNAKRPEMPYESDVVAKQAEAGDAVREAARRWVMPAYQALRERAGLPPAQTA